MIFVIGYACEKLSNVIKIPSLVFMILLGILIGPYAMHFMDDTMMKYASLFKNGALIIILLRSGLGIQQSVLKEVGVSAIKMSIFPCLLEGSAILICAHLLFDLPIREAGMLGFMIAAVSPAIIVPGMLHILKHHHNKRVPTLLLASSSIDDIIAITLFTMFQQMQANHPISLLIMIPLQILGAILFAYIAYRLFLLFTKILPASLYIFCILTLAMILYLMSDTIHYSGMLSIMACGYFIANHASCDIEAANRQLNQIWKYAKFFLFILIGAQVNISAITAAGLYSIILLFIGILFRFLGVQISLWKSTLSRNEKRFATLSFLPKATVQAALGSIPLSLGFPHGELLLAISVMSILLTAPLGAWLIDHFYEKLL